MSIIANALGAGISQGLTTLGNTMAQEQAAERELETRSRLRREESADKIEANRQALAEKLRANFLALREKYRLEAEKEGRAAKRDEDLYGISGQKTDRSKFERDETTYERTDDSEYSDAVSRKNAPLKSTTKKVFDEDGYNKAEGERVQRNIERTVATRKPEAYDDYQRGRSRGIVARELEKDPASKTAVAAGIAAEGRDRYTVQGNTVLDRAGIEPDRATDVGESIAKKNERPPLPRSTGGSGGGKGDADARALVTSLRTQASNIQRNITKLQEGFLTADKRASIEAAKAELADVNRRLRAAEAKIGGEKDPPPRDNRPGAAVPPARAQSGSLPGKKDFSSLWSN